MTCEEDFFEFTSDNMMYNDFFAIDYKQFLLRNAYKIVLQLLTTCQEQHLIKHV